MSCPACGASLVAGADRCPSCDTIVSPRLEGALAPDPLSITPPAPGEAGPLREIPRLRRKNKTWQDEVKERVGRRKRERSSGEDLPLFPSAEEEAADSPPDPAPEPPRAYAVTERMPFTDLGSDDATGREAVAPAREMALDDEPMPEWPPEPGLRQQAARPVERPARAAERFLAAVLDLAVLIAVSALVVYFAGRAAHVPLAGLRPGAPFLLGFLGLLGLAYAVYFTGTTGQTLGKMAGGLRVVDTMGRPPGALRAGVRAVLGTLGVALLGIGLATVFFDPARRALHDRLLRVRVIKA